MEGVSDWNLTDYHEWQEKGKSEGKALITRILLKKIRGSFVNVQIHNVIQNGTDQLSTSASMSR